MKNSPLPNKIVPKLWQTYLDNIHQEHEVEQNSPASKKFWKKYEALVQQSKPSHKNTPPKPQVKTTTSVRKSYNGVFLKYWNGISSTITYEQEIASKTIAKTVDEGDRQVGSIEIGIFMAIAAIIIVINMGFSGTFLLIIVFFYLLNFINPKRKDADVDAQSGGKTVLIPAYTIRYTFQIKADHLIFTKAVKNKSYEKTLRLNYRQVKSLTMRDNQLRLKSLYHKSLQDLMLARQIKEHFCIPIGMKEGKKITDFLREILILNKA